MEAFLSSMWILSVQNHGTTVSCHGRIGAAQVYPGYTPHGLTVGQFRRLSSGHRSPLRTLARQPEDEVSTEHALGICRGDRYARVRLRGCGTGGGSSVHDRDAWPAHVVLRRGLR